MAFAMRYRDSWKFAGFGLAILGASPAISQSETTTYSYDALGRVIEVESDRTAEIVTFDYHYDDADNRVSETVTEQTSSASSAGQGAVVSETALVTPEQ